MKIQKVAGALGAEIHGVDLRQPLSSSLAQEIRQVLLDNLVIFFRDQDLSPAQFMQFAQAMGEPVEYPFVKGLEGFPNIIEVKKLEHERSNFGGVWHSDTTYLEEPPMGSMLLAREIPPYGGQFQAVHPVMRTHPETQRPALYVNTAHTAGIEGMTSEESAPLLHFLFEHQIKPEFTCRFNWQPNSLAFWDNRCAMHNPVNDYHGFRRIMHRITLKGDRPA